MAEDVCEKTPAQMPGTPGVPQIRFRGFTDPWEQRKLGELVAEVVAGKSVNSSDEPAGDDDVAVLKTSCVSYGKFEPAERKKVIDAECKLVSCPVTANSLIVSRMNTPDRVGACGFSADGYKNLFLPDRLWRISPRPEVDPYLLYVILASDVSQTRIKGMASGTSGSMHNVPKTALLDMPVSFPLSLAEQRQIGAFFQRLDSLITLHQRKYDKLCTLKKAMLDKMFPKDGTAQPEIRFKGFTDPWEQRRLGEIARRVTRKNEKHESGLPLTISAQYGLVDQRSYFNNQVASKDMSGYFLLRRGEFAYNKSTSCDSPWGAVKRLVRYEKGCVSTLYICFELVESDPDWLVTYYETDRWHRGVQLVAAEGARNHGLLNIAPDDFFNTVLTLPADVSEQRQIGAFFQQLDSLITLHQRKLDSLKNVKTALLDRMFV